METRRAAGFSRQKLRYPRLVAEAIEAGGLPINTLSRKPDHEVCALFTATTGVGHWTADCYLMLALKRPDHWPVGNRAQIRALQDLKGLQERPGPERLDELGEHYRPYRSVATQ